MIYGNTSAAIAYSKVSIYKGFFFSARIRAICGKLSPLQGEYLPADKRKLDADPRRVHWRKASGCSGIASKSYSSANLLPELIQAKGSRYYGIGRRQHPAYHRQGMHDVKGQPVADRQPLVYADEFNALVWGKLLPLATVIEHGKSVVITFIEEGKERRYPAQYGDERYDHQHDGIYGLPEQVTESQSYAPFHALPQPAIAEGIFGAFYDGLRFFAQEAEYRRTDGQPDVFEPGKIGEQQYQPHHNAAQRKEKLQYGAVRIIYPGF